MDLLLAINQVISNHKGGCCFNRLRNSPLAVPDQDKGLTCIMVTHNPDLECYADRVLYVEDGCVSVCACVGDCTTTASPLLTLNLVLQFKEQVINTSQTRLDYEKYFKYLNEERFA